MADPHPEGRPAFVGVDVGTGSVRALVVDAEGAVRGSGVHPLRTWYPAAGFAEQASADVWGACCAAVRAAVAAAGPGGRVGGLCFAATSSLAVQDAAGRPVPVSDHAAATEEAGDADPVRDVFLWMDHRAVAAAARATATGHPMLQRAGGAASPEMSAPKALWLKEHWPERYRRAHKFFDLADHLAWRATGCDVRSHGCLCCKWPFSPDAGWDASWFEAIGLEDFVAEGFRQVGPAAQCPGRPVGAGLAAAAAAALGLPAGLPVASGAIDAYVGALALLGACPGPSPGPSPSPGPAPVPAAARLALITGTSACLVVLAARPVTVPGMWGPYPDALLPGLHLSEGGLTAFGALLDHVIGAHPCHPALAQQAANEQCVPAEILNRVLITLSGAASEPSAESDDGPYPVSPELARDVHVGPDFLGNRCPRADPSLRGSLCGLTISSTVEDLAVRYLATVQALGYGVRHLLETLRDGGFAFRSLAVGGGLSHNRLFLQQLADIVGLPLYRLAADHHVALGAAALAATAAGHFPSAAEAAARMAPAARCVRPAGDPAVAAFHAAKYAVYHELHRDQCKYRQMMRDAARNVDPT